MNNIERAKLAEDVTLVFATMNGSENETLTANMIDLLADKMHLCNREHIDFEELLRQARDHHFHETVGDDSE
jgi:hypothetical protein